MHKEMQYQQCREHEDPYFSVEEHQDKPDHHQDVNGKDNEKIPSRDLKIFMLKIFIDINSQPHNSEQHQCCKC